MDAVDYRETDANALAGQQRPSAGAGGVNLTTAAAAARARPDRAAVGLDIGGTKIAGGVVDASGTVLATVPPVPTPDDQEATVAAVRRQLAALRALRPGVEAVGVGAAGLVEWPAGRLRWAPHNAYRGLPLRRLLADACHLPVVVDNDANTAAWAEARLGHAADHLLFVGVGTGVGGGLVLDGELRRGRAGFAGEVGHMTVDPHGEVRCACGKTGCVEAVASGTALQRYAREAARADPGGTLAAVADGSGEVAGEEVLRAARAGDPTAASLYARMGGWLGIGIASLVTALDVELVVVGGGVAAAAGSRLLDPVRESAARHLFARPHREPPPIVPAALGSEAGWVGAGLLALDTAYPPIPIS